MQPQTQWLVHEDAWVEVLLLLQPQPGKVDQGKSLAEILQLQILQTEARAKRGVDTVLLEKCNPIYQLVHAGKT